MIELMAVPTRRVLLAASAAIGITRAAAAEVGAEAAGGGGSSLIRPFRVHVPEQDLTDLRRRIHATRWPERETVSDASRGVRLKTIQALADCWGTGHDWRKAEARLNAQPMFLTEIDGVDIHFIWVRSRQA